MQPDLSIDQAAFFDRPLSARQHSYENSAAKRNARFASSLARELFSFRKPFQAEILLFEPYLFT